MGQHDAASDATMDAVSAPARVAKRGEEISFEELQLAARNHGMPLEAMRCDITPVGLHYLLTHYDIPILDESAFQLTVEGMVEQQLRLDLNLIRSLPQRSVTTTMECAGNGRARLRPRPVSQPWLAEAVGTAIWTGTPLVGLLRQAGIGRDAREVIFTGADHGIERGVEQDYQRGLPLSEATQEGVLVVHEMNGAPLPPQHGGPVRLIVPGWYGMAQVKWLTRIELVAEPFDGFQMRAYRLRQSPEEPGTAVTRIEPRALLVPPGFPDFMSRLRVARAGAVVLEGRAWSGWAPISQVEVSTDNGATWVTAELEPPLGQQAWTRWTWNWEARTGQHQLAVRARDETGRIQPLEQGWNRGGFANNAIQRVEVTVID
jgi:DMSO/TMAO reductase YedYZ molybdopterin-dependent catalytic subunit